MARVSVEALRLYVVTDEGVMAGRDFLDAVAEAVAGGATCVQLREKILSTRDFVERARALKTLLAPLRVPLVINDRLDVALASEADGLHIGQSDMPFDLARKLLPEACFIGLSVETMADVEAVAGLDVDYLGVSPLFATPTKTDTGTPWGLEGLRKLRGRTDLPLVAIGGISRANAAEVIAAGADGLAVVSAVFGAPSPRAAARELKQAIDEFPRAAFH